jgi:hypothetical protein
MTITIEELERPTEWLRNLRENGALYRQLLETTGSLALAAHRLALARCRVQPVPTSVPTQAELRVAAAEIARHVGLKTGSHVAELVADCETAGLTVITPLAPRAA